MRLLTHNALKSVIKVADGAAPLGTSEDIKNATNHQLSE